MRECRRSLFLIVLILGVLCVSRSTGQERRGTITGRVTDASQGVLPGARVELQPTGKSAVSDAHGDFTITDITPGKYTLTVSYVGFEPFSTDVNVTGDAAARVEAVLQIGTQSESVTVRGDRERGEVEAINIERTADNIIQVLPNEVITSLPNTNIADALGRLPSVSLERDEGEGKYIQIRGTEPRLSNVTVNGIHLPSPEGVRNVKLDAIPADLVDMVEINKTLSANQDADAIGGSVNLVTKSPTDKPYVTLLGMGGYTPISGGRKLYQFDGTAGQRFGTDKKFGLLFGGSYDFNARGIDDLEPGQGVFSLPDGSAFVGPNTEDMRNYHYDRSRYGFDGEADYKLGEMSSVYLRGLFSKFSDNGEDWIYTPSLNNFVSNPADLANNTCGITTTGGVQGCGNMGFTDVYRTPGQQLFSVQAGARHAARTTLITYELALSEAHYTGGFAFAGFNGPGGNTLSPANGVAFGVDTKDPFVPKFPVLNGVNIYDPTQYQLGFADSEKDSIFERDVVGDISLNKQYSVASHYSSFEVGFKGWDAAKTSRFDRENFSSPANPLLMSDVLSNFKDHNYYFGNFPYGPVTEYKKILPIVLQAGPTSPLTPYNLRNSFNIGERVWAGYVMNTISFGRLRVQAGLRVESTGDALRAVNVVPDPTNSQKFIVTPVSTNKSYINPFPSVQAQYRFGSDTILRAAYGMGIARPNFGDLAPYFSQDPHSFPTFRAGNPNLKPTHGQNFDILLEHYLKPLGLIQGGFFYKALTNPIYTFNVPFPNPTSPTKEALLVNGPSAHIAGFEAAWQQHLSFLPGLLNGMGVSANYSYTTSRAALPAISGRSDHPTLLRTAPNNWNFDVTYDKKGLSARMGLTHNDGYIWSYGSSNLKDPTGDVYLYPHTQVDAQVSYWIPRGRGLQVVVSGLNLNNEVFGFYDGAEKYPQQREYYGRTISAGLRWTLSPPEPQ
jgi:TonB-dependent receptor